MYFNNSQLKARFLAVELPLRRMKRNCTIYCHAQKVSTTLWVLALLSYWVLALLSYWVLALLSYWVLALLSNWVLPFTEPFILWCTLYDMSLWQKVLPLNLGRFVYSFLFLSYYSYTKLWLLLFSMHWWVVKVKIGSFGHQGGLKTNILDENWHKAASGKWDNVGCLTSAQNSN